MIDNSIVAGNISRQRVSRCGTINSSIVTLVLLLMIFCYETAVPGANPHSSRICMYIN